MSRSGYTEDCDNNWDLIRWRGAVNAAMTGRRGVAFLTELVAAMDALPEKKLIADDLEVEDGAVCAIGAVGKARGIDMSKLDPQEPEGVAAAFGIAPAMAQEIVYMNDEAIGPKWVEGYGPPRRNNQKVYARIDVTPEERFGAMRKWAKDAIWAARGCVENPTGKLPRSTPAFSYWGTVLHYKAVVAVNEV